MPVPTCCPIRRLVSCSKGSLVWPSDQVSGTRLRRFDFFLFALFWLWGPRLFFFAGIKTSKNDNKHRDPFNAEFASFYYRVALASRCRYA